MYNDTNVHETPQLCNLCIKRKKWTDNIDCICTVGQAGCQAVGGKTEKEPKARIPFIGDRETRMQTEASAAVTL